MSTFGFHNLHNTRLLDLPPSSLLIQPPPPQQRYSPGPVRPSPIQIGGRPEPELERLRAQLNKLESFLHDLWGKTDASPSVAWCPIGEFCESKPPPLAEFKDQLPSGWHHLLYPMVQYEDCVVMRVKKVDPRSAQIIWGWVVVHDACRGGLFEFSSAPSG